MWLRAAIETLQELLQQPRDALVERDALGFLPCQRRAETLK
jgi:hypothetical protein